MSIPTSCKIANTDVALATVLNALRLEGMTHPETVEFSMVDDESLDESVASLDALIDIEAEETSPVCDEIMSDGDDESDDDAELDAAVIELIDDQEASDAREMFAEMDEREMMSANDVNTPPTEELTIDDWRAQNVDLALELTAMRVREDRLVAVLREQVHVAKRNYMELIDTLHEVERVRSTRARRF